MASLADLFSADSSIRAQRETYRAELLESMATKVAKDVHSGTARDVAVYTFASILKAMAPQGKGAADRATAVAESLVDEALDAIEDAEETSSETEEEVTAESEEGDNGETETEETSPGVAPKVRGRKAA